MGFLLVSSAAFLALLVFTDGGPGTACRPCRLVFLALLAIGCGAALWANLRLLAELFR